MRKISLLSLLSLLVTLSVFAQGPILEFEKTTHDFGSIKEEGGLVYYNFVFTNKGSQPLKIDSVKPSCGCTAAEWTKDPVPPGKTGFIKAQYDPMNRPGIINKNLTVIANTEPQTSMLFIKGEVIPKPKTPEDEYPDTLGSLRLKSRYLNMGPVTTKEPFTKEFDVYNASEKPVTFTPAANLPKHLKVVYEPATLQPKQKGIIKVIYDAKAKGDYGYVNDQFVLATNEGKRNVNVIATLSEYFPPMTDEEREKAPRVTFEKTVHDFEKVKEGDKAETEFVFTNNGKQDLIIRKTKASCGCTAGEPEKTTLKPGEKSKIKVIFNSAGREGQESKTVSVYTNDPVNPVTTLTIRVNVVKE